MQDYAHGKQSHLSALLFGVAVLILVAILFSTFAIGAYLFFDAPTSNVIAITQRSQSASYLVVNATSLDSNVSAILWMDPSVNYDANGYPASVDANSGFRIADTSTNSNGKLNGAFPISESLLGKIAADGVSVHSLWVILPNRSDSAGAQLMAISPYSEQNFSTATQRNAITLFVTLYTFPVPVNFDLGSLFIFLWTVYVILFAMAINGPVKSAIRALKDTWALGLSGVFENSILATASVFPLVLWSSVLLALLQQSVGVSTGSLPSTDPLLLFAELSIAPIREEIGFRVIPIGVGAMVILLARQRFRDALLSLWHPSKYLRKNLSPQAYKRQLWTMYILGAFSAFLFGLAHYVLGAGWGPGKITEAAIAGIALAALYYKYGLPAAILLHWAVDYALTSYELIPSLSVPYDIIVFYTLAIAVSSLVALILLLYRRMQSRKRLIQLAT